MKVVVGLPWKLEWDVSGLAKRVNGCFDAVSNLGVAIKLYCVEPIKKNRKFSVINVPVKTTPEIDVYSPLINSIAFSHEFAKRVTKEDYDVLHCTNTTSLFLTDRTHLFQTVNPTYAFALDVVKDEYPKTAKYERLLKYYASVAELEKIEYENAEVIIATSDVVKNNILRYYNVDKKKVVVIPNGVSPEECDFERPPIKQEGLKIVLFPGTMHIMKGFHYLVEAMAKVRKEFPGTILLVCGRIHPYEYEIFKTLIDRKRKESGIVLAGFLPREKLFRYYHLADVCCMPLLFGTMSIAILEAVAHGLPIITTSHSGFPEVDKVGVKIPSKDSEAIAEAILSLISNPKLCRSKSENAQKVMKNYLWPKIARKFLEVYETLQN